MWRSTERASLEKKPSTGLGHEPVLRREDELEAAGTLLGEPVSVAGHEVGPGFAVYAATKLAVRTLCEGLCQEVKPYNMRATVISPGAVATELPSSVTDPGAAERIRSSMRRSRFLPNPSRGQSPSPSASPRTWT
jgi:NADP-dependent 3-hydroxy acid dehydrogenase YdfG